jgi:hypothetical protein
MLQKMQQNRTVLSLQDSFLDSKSRCEQSNIHIVSHSLGAHVVLSALKSLHDDSRLALWNDRNYRIGSVHLLGAAVNPEDIATIELLGASIAIKDEVTLFRNEYCPEDDMLQNDYHNTEGRDALGSVRAADIVCPQKLEMLTFVVRYPGILTAIAYQIPRI